MRKLKRIIAAVSTSAVMLSMSSAAFAKPPGAQVFDVYDETQDGLVVADDPVTGQVEAVANPGGQARLIVTVQLKKAAPNCTYTVELVRDSAASNGGLDGSGHTGFIQILGTLTSNGVGNGNAHFDLDPSGDGVADTEAFGHIDIEADGSCTEADGTLVDFNEYGAAPDPTLLTPFTWLE